MKRKNRYALLLGILLITTALQASVITLGFDRITANSDINIEEQLYVDVISAGTGVEFKIYNDGPVMSSISEIYFYDGVLLDLSSIDDSCTGVDFEDVGDNVTPKALSGYNQTCLELFSATEAENPESSNGVNPGQWVTIGYTLVSGKNSQDLLDNLALGEVVIGLHVKSIGSIPDAPSDSFISTYVPEPATMGLLGLAGIVLIRKKNMI